MRVPEIAARAMLLGAGLLGFGGIAAASASAHAASDPQLFGAVALVCLAHAPVLLALGLFGRRDIALNIAAALLFAGTALFSVDVALRALAYGRLFPMAAPVGGFAMLAGWLGVAISAFTIGRFPGRGSPSGPS